MNTLSSYKISLLKRRENYKTSKTVLYLSNRITHNRTLSTLEEAIFIISSILHNKSMSSDSINLSIDYVKQYPEIFVNGIDESICFIIFSSYKLINDKNYDYLEYMNKQLTNIFNDIKDDISKKYKIALTEILIKLINLTAPIEKEEYIKSELSKAYYDLMYCIYEELDNNNDDIYFLKMKNLYKSLLQE